MSNIHEAIRQRRISLGLSQAEVARRSGLQQRQVSVFERGGDVTLNTLKRLAQALDMELLAVQRGEVARVTAPPNAAQEPAASTPVPSLLDRYQVRDDPKQADEREHPNG